MFSFEILPELILRTPFLSYEEYIRLSIRGLLANGHFRTAIFLASNSLYSELAAHDFRIEKLSAKTLFSIKKYANRMAYRTTPFGAFSSFSFIKQPYNKTGVVLTTQGYNLHISPDMENVLDMYKRVAAPNMYKSLRANQSTYHTGQDIRYLYREEQQSTSFNFTIHKLQNNTVINHIVLFCKREKPNESILAYLTQRLGLDEEDARELLHELVNLQVLEPAFQPNITGEDLYCRIKKFPGQGSFLIPDNKILENSPLNERDTVTLPANTAAFALETGITVKYYANLERHAEGGPAAAWHNDLQAAFSVLQKISPGAENKALTDFKSAFVKKFDRQAVPLMVALDPETGISYADLARPVNGDSLARDLNFTVEDTLPVSIEWGELQQMLMNKWHKNAAQITIDDEDLEKLPNRALKPPPGLSVVFKVYNDQLFIEQAGGVSATALTGRFTPLNNEILHHCQNIARKETCTNPDVDFAELAFLSDAHVDNINRRRSVWPFEIPIKTGSALPADTQISLSDLFISIHQGEILLWRTGSKKRVIPRLSSAYNFQRSELPVFRFLADLQYQGVQHTWGLDMMNLFPGLKYYPRVTYKNCILYPATWVPDKNTLKAIPAQNALAGYNWFVKKAGCIGLPNLFALVRSDQYLMFDLNDRQSIEMLLSEIRSEERPIFKEVFKENDYGGAVTDKQGRTYANQFIASVINNQAVYTGNYVKPAIIKKQTVKRLHLPGGEWLYYKIYCQEFNADSVLLAIAAITQKNKLFIYQWFFVRYRDPEPHLRVRMQVVANATGKLTKAVHTVLQKLQKINKINGAKIETYERELERYPPRVIPLAEQLFCISTGIVINFLKFNPKLTIPYPAYTAAIAVAYGIICYCITDALARGRFLNNVKENLFKEFGGSKSLKISLDQKKRELKNQSAGLLNDAFFYSNIKSIQNKKELFKTLGIITTNNKLFNEQLLADIVHMHMNRCFSTDMRQQEMVVYALMHQFELTRQKLHQ
ncbi:hypothetical protein EWM62_05540 [Mucilaginibacter terrigena]|uniref:Lantibiotic dehydratase n=1 Tax=Mucilaginibacter terrigena TaxID=2492395 RepID=A0A4Q5LPT3_9SPHI|nr:lantibiotic dehydratase [Mucilaginibacter terrigena]RYU91405.1 hypothetical protein EWM62_05540 [Mucilaginibacter terrigena]